MKNFAEEMKAFRRIKIIAFDFLERQKVIVDSLKDKKTKKQ